MSAYRFTWHRGLSDALGRLVEPPSSTKGPDPMSARRPRWELCRSDAGYWVRFRSSNGNIIVQSETYDRRGKALHAIGLVTGLWWSGAPVDDSMWAANAGAADKSVPIRDLTKAAS